MSTEFEAIADNCTPRNALFCCRSPVCLNNSPKLIPVTGSNTSSMEPQHQQQNATSKMFPEQNPQYTGHVFPVRVPDLSDPMFYTNLMSQPTPNSNHKAAENQTTNNLQSTQPAGEPFKTNAINKSQSAIDVRHGVTLRRVTPPKSTVTVRKNDAPMLNVVLRKVEKKLLEPPKPKHEKSPPPKKLTAAATNADVNILKTKKSRNALNNQNAIAKSKSTNDVLTKQKEIAKEPAAKPPPPVNLLLTQRPPLEIHKIEGDKIIIIRRVPRGQRRMAADSDLKHKSLPSLPEATGNQVTFLYVWL